MATTALLSASFPSVGGAVSRKPVVIVPSLSVVGAAAVESSELDDDPALSLCILFFTALESRLFRSDLVGPGFVGSAATDGAFASDVKDGWGDDKVEVLLLVESVPVSAHTFLKHSSRRDIDESGGRLTGGAFASAALTEGDVATSASTVWPSKTSKRSSN